MGGGIVLAALLVLVAIWAALESAFSGADLVIYLEEDPDRDGCKVEAEIIGLLGWTVVSVSSAVTAGVML